MLENLVTKPANEAAMYSSNTLVTLFLVFIQDVATDNLDNSTNIIKSPYDVQTVISKLTEIRKDMMLNYPSYDDGSFFLPPPIGSEVMLEHGTLRVIIDVYMYMHIERILKMEVKEQALTIIIQEWYLWYDESLRWNETEAHTTLGIDYILLNTTQIWTPIMAYANVLHSVQLSDNRYVTSLSEGYCRLYKKSQLTIPCAVNVHNFPFDTHNCSFKVFSKHDVNRLKFVENEEMYGVARDYHSHLEWEIIDTKVEILKEQDSSQYQVYIVVQRQGLFYSVVLLFPLTLLNLLSLVIFTLPVHTTERERFALTLILTYFVFITIVINSSPPSGEHMPMLGLYIILCTGLVVISFGMSLLLIEIHEHCLAKKRKMPNWLSKCVERYCCMQKVYNLKYKRQYSEKLAGKCNDVNTETKEELMLKENNQSKDAKQKLEFEKFKMTQEYEKNYKWKILINSLNFIFFILILLAHIILGLVIFLH